MTRERAAYAVMAVGAVAWAARTLWDAIPVPDLFPTTPEFTGCQPTCPCRCNRTVCGCHE